MDESLNKLANLTLHKIHPLDYRTRDSYEASHSHPPILKAELNNGQPVIFKPLRERTIKNAQFCYQLSEFLDLNLVPPLVEKTIDGTTGILQHFIDDALQRERNLQYRYLNKKTYLASWLKKIVKLDFTPIPSLKYRILNTNVYLFYYLSGITDIDKENILLENGTGNIKLIDYNSASWIHKTQLGHRPFMKEEPLNAQHLETIDLSDLVQFPLQEAKLINLQNYRQFMIDYKNFLQENRRDEIIHRLHNNEYKNNEFRFVFYKNHLWIERNESSYLNNIEQLVTPKNKECLANKDFDLFLTNNKEFMFPEMQASFTDRLTQLYQAFNK